MSTDDGPGGIPRAMNFVLVLLQTDQPPTTDSHAEECENPPEDGAGYERGAAVSCQSNEKTAPCACYQGDCQREMAP